MPFLSHGTGWHEDLKGLSTKNRLVTEGMKCPEALGCNPQSSTGNETAQLLKDTEKERLIQL